MKATYLFSDLTTLPLHSNAKSPPNHIGYERVKDCAHEG